LGFADQAYLQTRAPFACRTATAKIEAVLNDTQKQQFEQMLQERRAHHKAQTRAE